MALYEITIGNQSGDTNYSMLVLSNEPLNETNVDFITGIDKGWGEYIVDVSIARVRTNSWDEEEEKELMNIRKQLL
jgi:hypothetical protein